MSENPNNEGGQLRVTLVKSTIGRPFDQERAVRSLGLRKLNSSVVVKDNPSIRGQVQKIHHLVKVETIAAE
jgi:large subunit ribosomal protein L30